MVKWTRAASYAGEMWIVDVTSQAQVQVADAEPGYVAIDVPGCNYRMDIDATEAMIAALQEAVVKARSALEVPRDS